MRILHYERENNPLPVLQKVILQQILLSYIFIYISPLSEKKKKSW